MNSGVEAWAMAVRVLALISAVLVVLAVLEARTIRDLRSELQSLRAGAITSGAASATNPCAQ